MDKGSRSGIFPDPDPDPGDQKDRIRSDPDPQHWFILKGGYRILFRGKILGTKDGKMKKKVVLKLRKGTRNKETKTIQKLKRGTKM